MSRQESGPDVFFIALTSSLLLDPERGYRIAKYALGDDYHNLIYKRLKKLCRYLSETFGSVQRPYVDTGPLLEKPIAEAAGLGDGQEHDPRRAQAGNLVLPRQYRDHPGVAGHRGGHRLCSSQGFRFRLSYGELVGYGRLVRASMASTRSISRWWCSGSWKEPAPCG